MTALETPNITELDQLKARLKATWMTGNYDLFSRFMEKSAKSFFDRLASRPALGFSTSAAEQDDLH